MTFEAWIRMNPSVWGLEGTTAGESRLFTMQSGSNRVADMYVMSGGTWRWRPSTGNTNNTQDLPLTYNSTVYNNVWAHVVYTRKYDSTTKTWYANAYINGKKMQTNDTSFVLERVAETATELIIGNTTGTTAFRGDIATFKVYNTILTEASVKSKYDASVANFVDQVTFSEFTTASESVTATLGDSLSAKVEELDGTTIMALYAVDENGVETLIHYSEGLTLAIPQGVTLEEGMIIKCFIWNNTTDCTPLSRHYSVQCLQ